MFEISPQLYTILQDLRSGYTKPSVGAWSGIDPKPGIGMPKDLWMSGLISQFYTTLQDPRKGYTKPSVEPNSDIEACEPIKVLEGGCFTCYRTGEFEDIKWFAT